MRGRGVQSPAGPLPPLPLPTCGLARASSSAATHATWPASAARKSGAAPPRSLVSTPAPSASRPRSARSSPRSAAACSGVARAVLLQLAAHLSARRSASPPEAAAADGQAPCAGVSPPPPAERCCSACVARSTHCARDRSHSSAGGAQPRCGAPAKRGRGAPLPLKRVRAAATRESTGGGKKVSSTARRRGSCSSTAASAAADSTIQGASAARGVPRGARLPHRRWLVAGAAPCCRPQPCPCVRSASHSSGSSASAWESAPAHELGGMASLEPADAAAAAAEAAGSAPPPPPPAGGATPQPPATVHSQVPPPSMRYSRCGHSVASVARAARLTPLQLFKASTRTAPPCSGVTAAGAASNADEEEEPEVPELLPPGCAPRRASCCSAASTLLLAVSAGGRWSARCVRSRWLRASTARAGSRPAREACSSSLRAEHRIWKHLCRLSARSGGRKGGPSGRPATEARVRAVTR